MTIENVKKIHHALKTLPKEDFLSFLKIKELCKYITGSPITEEEKENLKTSLKEVIKSSPTTKDIVISTNEDLIVVIKMIKSRAIAISKQ